MSILVPTAPASDQLHRDALTVLQPGFVGTEPPDWLRRHLAGALARLNAGAGAASRVERLVLVAEPPSLEAGELTDKGYLNQRVVVEQRGDVVELLYAEEPEPGRVIVAGC